MLYPKSNFKRLAVASILAGLSVSALATNYYYIQPKSSEMSKVSPLSVTLGSQVLPSAFIGQVYNGTGYDLAPLASVSGDPALNQSLVTFALTSGNLPAGLALSTAGKLTGTPTAGGNAVIQVTANYKTASGAQTYTLSVTDASTIVVGALTYVSVPARLAYADARTTCAGTFNGVTGWRLPSATELINLVRVTSTSTLTAKGWLWADYPWYLSAEPGGNGQNVIHITGANASWVYFGDLAHVACVR